MNVESIDLYVNYSCNMSCNHCFLGEKLHQKEIMTANDVNEIVKYCRQFLDTNEVVLLGGEPTLHKNINTIINVIIGCGIDKIRIVTNGGVSCESFITNYSYSYKPKLVFSVDGSNSLIHDIVRGKGAFKQLIRSVETAKQLGFEIDAITSVSTVNQIDLLNILDFLEEHKFGIVNVHYVSARGNANSHMQVPPEEWVLLREKVFRHTKTMNVTTRFETTFVDTKVVSVTKASCRIVNKNNLMFFPGGNVYICGLFIGTNYNSGFFWKDGHLIENSVNSEISVCAKGCVTGCPGMEIISSKSGLNIKPDDYAFSCIYDKELIH